MSRLLDKTIVLLICLALLVRGPVDAALVSWLCVAVTVACLGEAVPARVRPALPLLLLACGALAPDARAYLPLAAYDLARPWLPGGRDARGWPRVLPAAAGALLACACAAATPATAPVTLLCVGLACLLSVRSTQTERSAAANRQTRDALRGRALELAAKNRDLMDRQEYEVELATLAERARIAREIHDNVGHLLTRATLQVEALRVVHAGEPRVAADFADVGTTLGEALSNVLRHATAERVVLRCVEHPGFFQLEVTDDGTARGADGTAADGTAASTGMGLASMRERVEALGGTFRAGPCADGGWRVFATVPKGGAGRGAA